MQLPSQPVGTAEPETSSPQRPLRSIYSTARLVALATVGVASGSLYWQARYLHGLKGGISEYVLVFLVQFSLYLLACYFVVRDKGSLWTGAGRGTRLAGVSIVLLVAACLRAELIAQTPFLSTDVYRYIWDGRVQAAGINPYRYLPSDPELENLRDESIYRFINRRDFAHTIYPPAAQVIFLGIYLVSPSSVPGFKTAMSVFDLASIAAIMLALRRNGLSPLRVIVFAWHPLVIWEGAHSGHIESAVIAFLAAALLAWSYKRPALTGAAIALATLVKFYPALLLPVFMFSDASDSVHVPGETQWWRHPRGWMTKSRRILLSRSNLQMLAAFAATVLLAYLPYLTVGLGVTGYLEGYLREEGFVDAGNRYFVLALVREVASLPAFLYAVIAALLLGVIAVRTLFLRKRNAVDIAGYGALLVGLFMALSSPRYSWYVASIIPFLCFAPRAGWLYLSGASVLLYLLWLTDYYPGVPIWLGTALYMPALALLMWEHWKRRSETVNE